MAVDLIMNRMVRNGMLRSYTRFMSLALLLALFTILAPVAQTRDETLPQPKTRQKSIDFAKERAWWSYAPLATVTPPQVNDESWCESDIDRFILAKLQASGLAPAPRASRTTLIRRASFDLTGLPPTPQEVDAFVADDREDAWEHLIERLLASEKYGERWARHWLDLVRYADTNGFERDGDKPAAWRYRDWVIAAFNSDKPYDRFLLEQLAGDEIANRNFDSMVATGYYRLGMWDDEVPDLAQALADDLDSIVDTTSRTMLGMGLGCARCHDHKGDPIPQRDYYAFAAHFAGLKPYKNGNGNSLEAASVLRVLSRDFAVIGEATVRADWTGARESLIEQLREIESHAGVAATPTTRGLVAHYPFETRSDASEEERARALSIIADHAGTVVDLSWGAPGKTGLCASFDGGDDRVSIPATIRDDFTIAFWFKSDRIAPGSASDPRWFTGAGLVDAEVPGIVDDFGISMIDNGVIAAGVGNPETFVNSSPGFNDGLWHHVAFTRLRSSGEIALFIDAIEVMRARGGTQSLTAADSISIGAIRAGGRAFTGAIDEVQLFERPLSQVELLTLAASVASPQSMQLSLSDSTGAAALTKWSDRYQQLASLKPLEWRGSEVLCASELADPNTTNVLIRGSPHAPAEEVSPAPPQIAAILPAMVAADVYASESSGRRLALAEWITAPNNFLTLRTIANRLWQYHFNRGICPTPNDFGHFGELPTHPELLDWLAQRFVSDGWSMKQMHRLIMSSATYQMTSTATDQALQLDPANELLSRFRLRRLESEEIRDSVLSVNGSLNTQMGGPGIRPPLPEAVLATSSKPDEVWPVTDRASWSRRSVYIHAKRSLQHPLLAIFDQADIDSSCPVRFSTVQPTQALTMLNSEFTNSEAGVFATRLRSDYPGDLRAQIEHAMRLAYCRPIDSHEIDEGVDFIADLQRTESMSESTALETLTLALLNSNEFMHVD